MKEIAMWNEIKIQDGSYGFYDHENIWRAVIDVNAVLKDWNPYGIASFGSFYVMEFRNGNSVASWFLDESMTRRGGSIGELPQDFRRLVLADIFDHVRKFVDTVLFSCVTDGDDCVFSYLNSLTRFEIISAVFDRQATKTKTVDVSSSSKQDFGFLPDALNIDLQSAIANSAGGPIIFLDPFNGLEIKIKHSIVMDDFRTFLRVETASNGVAYVCASDHYFRTIGIYDYKTNILYCKDANDCRVGGAHFSNVFHDLAIHAALYHSELRHYLKSHDTRIAGMLRPPPSHHIGHQLWNELTGLQTLVDNIATNELPYVLVPQAHMGTEIYGPTEDLFHQFSGKVIRLDEADLSKEIYLRNLIVVRITSRFVSERLRTKVSTHAICNTAIDVKTKLCNFRSQKKQIILLGLRVENRTITNLKDFCIELVNMIADFARDSVIVLDGHNVRETSLGLLPFASTGEIAGKQSPIEYEKDIADAMKAAATEKGVDFISLVGEPVSHSLYWSINSDIIVSIWGAGLAKYRWVANRPCLVLTSKWNLLNRRDLDLYSSNVYMESPAPLTYIREDYATDCPEAEQLVPVPFTDQNSLGYVNFEIDMNGLKLQLFEMLDSVKSA
ncbi:hypothetical protein [Methylobacterium indicum]|uniref:hypothetical protein n=1 Tax=Methylobacterium indicum TaxID=1775910 RepID=UPI002435F87C|nr:hypothetical protein [Methylobacterium indicum]